MCNAKFMTGTASFKSTFRIGTEERVISGSACMASTVCIAMSNELGSC